MRAEKHGRRKIIVVYYFCRSFCLQKSQLQKPIGEERRGERIKQRMKLIKFVVEKNCKIEIHTEKRNSEADMQVKEIGLEKGL